MNKKIMAVIYSEKGKFLLLKTNPKFMKQNCWFVVTGSVKDKESEEEAVIREIDEETKLKIVNIKKVNYCCEYEWPKNSGKMHSEQAFLVKVKEGSVRLNKWEHLDYKWLDKEEFMNTIGWRKEDIEKLMEIIKSAK